MPFVSPAQRRAMHAKAPEVADRWEREAKASGKPAVVRRKKKATPKRRKKK